MSEKKDIGRGDGTMEPKRMTNKEYLIAVLTDDPRVEGCDYQSEIYNHITCPYYQGDKRAKCVNKSLDEVTRRLCEECKCEWLEQEVDE